MPTVLAALASVAMSVAIMGGAPAVAHAEWPLYCAANFNINGGCAGPTETQQYNETRNENGSCIAAQWWLNEGGYSKVEEVCEGRVIIYKITVPWLSFPKCWNRSNAYDLIHCRHH